MRMAHLLGAKGDGGAEGFFERLTIALHQAGEVVLPVVRPHAERVAKLQAAGLDPVELPFGGYLDFRTGPRLGALLRDWRPEVVVAWRTTGASPYVRSPTAGNSMNWGEPSWPSGGGGGSVMVVV